MNDAISLDDQAVLAESRHRHANAYQCILSMIAGERVGASHSETVDALVKTEMQIRAFALLNYLLDGAAGADRSAEPCAAEYLDRLCQQRMPACLTPLGIRFHYTADAPQYHPASTCRNFGLITTELVLNAAKHAFSGRQDGTVSVALLDAQPGVTQLVVIDNGCGIEQFAPSPRRGLGFVELLASSMGGRCNGYSDASGTRIEITIPRPA